MFFLIFPSLSENRKRWRIDQKVTFAHKHNKVNIIISLLWHKWSKTSYKIFTFFEVRNPALLIQNMKLLFFKDVESLKNIYFICTRMMKNSYNLNLVINCDLYINKALFCLHFFGIYKFETEWDIYNLFCISIIHW